MKIGTDVFDFSVESEVHHINGQKYEVYFIPRKWWDEDPRALGTAFCDRNIAHVRQELSKPVRKFVTYHEVYHLMDPYTWGGWLGAEIRANLVAGICHPFGALLAIIQTITSPERRALYIDRFRYGY